MSAESSVGPELIPDSSEPAFTWQARIEGVTVIGFIDRTGSANDPRATFDRDVAEFGHRMESLLSSDARCAVVDFSSYRMTDWDNGRAIVSLLLVTHKGLRSRGGGLLVCHHPAQLNPDLQGLFKLDRIIGLYRSRQDAITAALSLGEASRDRP